MKTAPHNSQFIPCLWHEQETILQYPTAKLQGLRNRNNQLSTLLETHVSLTTKALLQAIGVRGSKVWCQYHIPADAWPGLDFSMVPRSILTLSSILVSRCQPLHQIVSTCHVAVFSSCFLVGARYGLYHAVVVRVTEVCNGVPWWVDILVCILRLGWWLDYAVFGRLDCVIGPSCQEVASIYDDSSFDGSCANECALR
jgi:hypothetical protein